MEKKSKHTDSPLGEKATVQTKQINSEEPSGVVTSSPVASSALSERSALRRISDWGRHWAGFMGIVVAVFGVGVSSYQAMLAHDAVRLSVKPWVRFGAYAEGPGKKNGLYIMNLGLGPAKISKLSIEVDGKLFDLLKPGGQRNALKAMGAELKCFTEVTPEVGTVLKVGEEPLMAETNSSLVPLCPLWIAQTFGSRTSRVDVEYFSLFDEKFHDSQSIHIDMDAFYERYPNMISK